MNKKKEMIDLFEEKQSTYLHILAHASNLDEIVYVCTRL